jgi:hypothetical protein
MVSDIISISACLKGRVITNNSKLYHWVSCGLAGRAVVSLPLESDEKTNSQAGSNAV